MREDGYVLLLEFCCLNLKKMSESQLVIKLSQTEAFPRTSSKVPEGKEARISPKKMWTMIVSACTTIIRLAR